MEQNTQDEHYKLAPFAEQDMLNLGLLKTARDDGMYLSIDPFCVPEGYGASLSGVVYKFSNLQEQDKLDGGLIRVEGLAAYFNIDSLGEVIPISNKTSSPKKEKEGGLGGLLENSRNDSSTEGYSQNKIEEETQKPYCDKREPERTAYEGAGCLAPIAGVIGSIVGIYIGLSIVDGMKNSGQCFVATVVYGDENAHQVRTLREYRDNVLNKNPIGKVLVDFYYSGAGEKTAGFIKNHLPPSISIIRRGLDEVVKRYEKRVHTTN